METSVTSYWMALNFRYVPEKGKKGKRREHIPLAEGCPRTSHVDLFDANLLAKTSHSVYIDHTLATLKAKSHSCKSIVFEDPLH